MQNTGKPSEEAFDTAWDMLGKRAHVFKFTDTAEARGMNRGKVMIKAQPSDRLLTYQGVISYAEIKSTTDPDTFSFGLLRKTQSAYAAFILGAGGPYDVYLHRLAFDRWYRIPYAVIKAAKEAGRGSFKFTELESFTWQLPRL